MVNALAPAAFDTRLFSVFTPEGDAALRGRPPELEISLDSAEYLALLTASRVTPMALALVHRSCPATAQVFGATGGYFAATRSRTPRAQRSGPTRPWRIRGKLGSHSRAVAAKRA